MKRLSTLIFAILIGSLAFSDGWLNAYTMIKKSVDSTKATPMSFDRTEKTMASISDLTISGASTGVTAYSAGTGASVNLGMMSAETVGMLFEGKHVGYTGKAENGVVGLGLFTVKDPGISYFMLSLLNLKESAGTKTRLTINVDDTGNYRLNGDPKGRKIVVKYAFSNLGAYESSSLEALLTGRLPGGLILQNLQKELFTPPYSQFDRAKIGSRTETVENLNPNGELFTELWMKVRIGRNLPAGLYTDTLTVTVHANPHF